MQTDKSYSHHSQNIPRKWVGPVCHWVALMQSWVRLASVKLSARRFLSWACLAGLCLTPAAAQASNLQKKKKIGIKETKHRQGVLKKQTNNVLRRRNGHCTIVRGRIMCLLFCIFHVPRELVHRISLMFPICLIDDTNNTTVWNEVFPYYNALNSPSGVFSFTSTGIVGIVKVGGLSLMSFISTSKDSSLSNNSLVSLS